VSQHEANKTSDDSVFRYHVTITSKNVKETHRYYKPLVILHFRGGSGPVSRLSSKMYKLNHA